MNVGVVVGRFQVDELHPGQVALLREACYNAAVCVMVGTTENRGSRRNPLDFVTRKFMLETFFRREYPGLPVTILPIHDHSSDAVWSKNLDRVLADTFPGANIALYDGRDGFSARYLGRHTPLFVNSGVASDSGFRIRGEVSDAILDTRDFRRGIIYGAYNQWPRLFMTVDAALLSADGKSLYLGRRKDDSGARFFGGFVDQNDVSLEAAIRRELFEEAGSGVSVNFSPPEFVTSCHVADHRYKTPDDGFIMTSLFLARMTKDSEKPNAGDDIDEVVKFPVEGLWGRIPDIITPSHQELMVKLLTYLEKNP